MSTRCSSVAPQDSACGAAIEQLSKQHRAIQPRALGVDQAHRGKMVGFAKLMVCYPGGEFSARKAQDCVTAQREVPLKIRKLVEAESDLDAAVRGFEERVHDLLRVFVWTGIDVSPFRLVESGTA